MDPLALNYNMFANIDDGSCNYPLVPGCTDPNALNYDPNATIDDGSCNYCDLTITWLNGVDESVCGVSNDGWAYVSASSSYPPIQYNWSNGVTGQFNNPLGQGIYTVTVTDAAGCTVDSAITICTVATGCTDPIACNYDATALFDDGSCIYGDSTSTFITTIKSLLVYISP